MVKIDLEKILQVVLELRGDKVKQVALSLIVGARSIPSSGQMMEWWRRKRLKHHRLQGVCLIYKHKYHGCMTYHWQGFSVQTRTPLCTLRLIEYTAGAELDEKVRECISEETNQNPSSETWSYLKMEKSMWDNELKITKTVASSHLWEYSEALAPRQ